MYTSEDLLNNILALGDWETWEESIDQVEKNVTEWKGGKTKNTYQRVYLVGCGSSYYSGQIGKYFIEDNANILAEARQAFSFVHYAKPELITQDTLVIGISTTGNTVATCDALILAKKCGADTLAITADPASKITKIADHSVFTGGPVTVIVKTFEYVQSLIALYILSFNLGNAGQEQRDKLRKHYLNHLQHAADISRTFFDKQQEEIFHLVEKFKDAEMFFMLGNGINTGTAEEAALKLIEMAKIYSDGCEMEDFFHGRDREITEKSPVFFLAPKNSASEKMKDFLKFNQIADVPSVVFTVGGDTEYENLAEEVISLEGILDEKLTPMVYVSPLYLFCHYLALERGYKPLDRRYEVGALEVSYKD